MMTAAALAAALGLTGPWPAWVTSPEFTRTGEEQAKLRDDVIEYGELAGLIHEYNATVQNNRYDYQRFREDYRDTNSEMADAYHDLAQDYYNDMPGEDDASSRMSDPNLQILGNNMTEQADESLKDSKICLLTHEQTERNLVVTAQSKMISCYKQLLRQQQKEVSLEKVEQDYSLAQVKYAAGTITQAEVLSAREAVQSAEDEFKQLGSEIRNTKETLLVLLGWNYNGSPVIGELSELDMSRIDSMDPEKDLNQAPENNCTLKINRRKPENAKGQTIPDSLKTAIANNEKQIGASLSSAYKSVLSAKITYQQTLIQAQLEKTNTQIAADRLQADMMTRLEYEKQVYTRDNSRVTSKTTTLSLMVAMENYQWEINGLAAAEQQEMRRLIKKRKWAMYLILLGTTAVSSFCHAGTAWADMEEAQEEIQQEAQKNKQDPGDEGEVQEYLGEEQSEKLKDQVLEYSEIQDVIRNYNPSVQEAVSAYNRILEQYADGWAEMKFGKNSIATDKKNAKGSGDAQRYSYCTAEEAIYQSAVRSYQKMYDSMQSASSTSSQQKIEWQMTVATRPLVIFYETMRPERNALEKERKPYQKQYELAVVREQAGMGTQADVLGALNQVQSAEASIASTDKSMAGPCDPIYPSVGRDTDRRAVIAEIPAADTKRADGIKLEGDTRKAIGNNDTLMSDRHSLQAVSTSSSSYKLRTMERGEQRLANKMKSLYGSVQQKKKALETAATGYEKAGRERQNADTKYSIGMLNQDEYLKEQMNYIQRTAEYRSTDLAFTQAMDAYDWAVLGIVDIEAQRRGNR